MMNVEKASRKKHRIGVILCIASIILPCWSKTSIYSDKDVESIQGYFLLNITQKLSEDFNRTYNEELGISFIKKIYATFNYAAVARDPNKVLNKICNKLEEKLNETFTILNHTKSVIETLYTKNPLLLQSAVQPCSKPRNILTEYEIYNLKDNTSNTYLEQTFNINYLLLKTEANLKYLKGAVKQLYFIYTPDVASESPLQMSKCDNHDQSLLWKTFMSHAKSRRRNVMLLLDHGGSLSRWQFQIVKAVAKQMISVLDENDRVGLVAISDDWSSPYFTDQCVMPNQMPPSSHLCNITYATQHNKNLLNKFIDTISKGNGGTNHSLGFQQILQAVLDSDIPQNETVMVLYISRGLLSSLREAKTVLQTISDVMEQIQNPVIINTCAVINESKPVMYEMHFLRDIADQNYSKYNIDASDDFQKGVTLSVYSLQNVGLAVARFYNVLKDVISYDTSPRITLPLWYNTSKDLAISAFTPCGKEGEIGMLGMDIYFSNLAEDVIYYSNYEHYTYSFIIDMNGLAIVHPSYPRPVASKKQPKYIDISYLEKRNQFSVVREKLLRDIEGKFVLTDYNATLKYVWKRVVDWYVVCVVINERDSVPHRPYKINWYTNSPGSPLVHHRLDIIPVPNLCMHLNQIATLDAGSLYLSASCFESPFSHMYSSPDSPFSYMAYIKDNTRLLANPGLKEEIRDDVATLSIVLDYLRNQHLNGYRSRYIVRRYVTSYSGVLQMFPGGVIFPGLEPTKRTWFLRASEYKHRTILTPPYLDAGGAGYIVTLAYATSHIVVAMDVTYGYIFKLLLEQMPFCAEKKNIKCFMIDDRGYLIYHPNLIDPNGHGPIEQQHIIHKESLVANDILNHKHFVKKILCNNYADDTIQRYYRLNMSLEGVLMNSVQCVKYQISAVKGTNVFVGVVNASCEVITTFCPCSIIDRYCFNCNSMEQIQCECPCECPLNLNTCTHPVTNFTENALCSAVPEQSTSKIPEAVNKINPDLKPCIPFTCESQLTYNSCLGITGCEWCQTDVDGTTLLSAPFCTSIMACFNGILGSPTPYGRSSNENAASEDSLNSQYSPVGPVIGSVIGIALVLTLLFFCYRSYTSQAVERFYLTSTQENQVRMSDLNISDDYHELDNHQDKLLQDSKKPEVISPYCVSTAYRRPPTVVDSDHGYSTMTPHDESEHLSFAPVEIDSLEDDCTSDNASINTSLSSKTPQMFMLQKNKSKLINSPLTDIQMAAIPNRNCIVAPVTVHRNMETTQ